MQSDIGNNNQNAAQFTSGETSSSDDTISGATISAAKGPSAARFIDLQGKSA